MSKTFDSLDHLRESSGKLATKNSPEAANVKLRFSAPQRCPELVGLPEHMTEPTVDFSVGGEDGITTKVTVEGEGSFSVWTVDSCGADAPTPDVRFGTLPKLHDGDSALR